MNDKIVIMQNDPSLTPPNYVKMRMIAKMKTILIMNKKLHEEKIISKHREIKYKERMILREIMKRNDLSPLEKARLKNRIKIELMWEVKKMINEGNISLWQQERTMMLMLRNVDINEIMFNNRGTHWG